jgi:cell division initiation protein
MMSDRLTPMDVENQTFKRKLRGYDPEEVDLFLKSVAEEMTRLALDNTELKEGRAHLEQRVEDFKTRERTLQETLVTAQRMADELKEKTTTESEIMIKEARIKTERMLAQAQEQLADIETEISRARLERDLFENRLRGLVEEHLAMIDLRKEERDEPDTNVRFLHRRSGGEAG